MSGLLAATELGPTAEGELRAWTIPGLATSWLTTGIVAQFSPREQDKVEETNGFKEILDYVKLGGPGHKDCVSIWNRLVKCMMHKKRSRFKDRPAAALKICKVHMEIYYRCARKYGSDEDDLPGGWDEKAAPTTPTRYAKKVIPPCPPALNPGGGLGKGWERGSTHPGAKVCFRSKTGGPGGPGQQCCYDAAGKLLTAPPAGGNIDIVSPGGFLGEDWTDHALIDGRGKIWDDDYKFDWAIHCCMRKLGIPSGTAGKGKTVQRVMRAYTYCLRKVSWTKAGGGDPYKDECEKKKK